MATRLLPDPVGVDRMTFAPETTSMSASSWCGYSASPRRLDHPAKASKTASGSGVAGSRSVSVITVPWCRARTTACAKVGAKEGERHQVQQRSGPYYSAERTGCTLPRRPGRSSCEQGITVVLARAQAGRDGEDGAAGVVDVLVQGVARQRGLELDELGWVLHEGDEEQAAEERAGLRVDAVGEGVAAAQDTDPAVVLGTGQPDVRVGGDGGLPVGAGGGSWCR